MTRISPEKLEAMRSIGFLSRGRTGPKVREYRTEASGRVKETTDELGNTVTQHAKGDRQDVHIKAPTVAVTTTTAEVR